MWKIKPKNNFCQQENIFTDKEKISRRDFLGLSAKGDAATMLAGVFVPGIGSMVGLSSVAEKGD